MGKSFASTVPSSLGILVLGILFELFLGITRRFLLFTGFNHRLSVCFFSSNLLNNWERVFVFLGNYNWIRITFCFTLGLFLQLSDELFISAISSSFTFATA